MPPLTPVLLTPSNRLRRAWEIGTMASSGLVCWAMAVGSFCSTVTAHVPGLVRAGLTEARRVLRMPEPVGGMRGMMGSVDALGLVSDTVPVPAAAPAAVVKVNDVALCTLATVSPEGMPGPLIAQPTLALATGPLGAPPLGSVTVVDPLVVVALLTTTPLIRGSLQATHDPVLAA